MTESTKTQVRLAGPFELGPYNPNFQEEIGILSPMPRFVDVAAVDEIPIGKGRAFAVEGQMIAVFNDSGTFQAIDDFCPHMGASLAEGWLEKGCVACPWHAWRFQLSDGAWLDNPKTKTKVFPVRVINNRIEVEV